MAHVLAVLCTATAAALLLVACAAPSPREAAIKTSGPSEHTVAYSVVRTSPNATITWATPDGAVEGRVSVPSRGSDASRSYPMQSGTLAWMAAKGVGDGYIMCQILIDGQVAAVAQSDAGLGGEAVTCRATVR